MDGEHDFAAILASEGLVALKPDDLEQMLERAAHRGAKRALEGVGLHDDDAGNDVRDLRALIRDWRTVRTGFLRAFGRILFWAFVAIVTAFGLKTGVLDSFGGK